MAFSTGRQTAKKLHLYASTTPKEAESEEEFGEDERREAESERASDLAGFKRQWESEVKQAVVIIGVGVARSLPVSGCYRWIDQFPFSRFFKSSSCSCWLVRCFFCQAIERPPAGKATSHGPQSNAPTGIRMMGRDNTEKSTAPLRIPRQSGYCHSPASVEGCP